MRIIVGVSGAEADPSTDSDCFEKLRMRPDVEIHLHLILSRAAERTAHLETEHSAADFKNLAHSVYPFEDIGSRLASGSFLTDGMVIAPCSIQTMSADRDWRQFKSVGPGGGRLSQGKTSS